MLWHNFADLFGMHAVVLRSYRPLFFPFIYSYLDRKNFVWVRMLAIMPARKMIWQANDRRLSVENFDEENVDELIKIRQIRQYFPPSKFCAIRYELQIKET